MFKDYNNELDTSVRGNANQHDHKTMFNDAWDSIKGRYDSLRLAREVVRLQQRGYPWW